MNENTTALAWPFPTIANDYKAGQSPWREILESAFDQLFEVMPLLRHRALGFVVSEPYDHTDQGEGIYTHCIKERDSNTGQWRYYARLGTLAQFDTDYFKPIALAA